MSVMIDVVCLALLCVALALDRISAFYRVELYSYVGWPLLWGAFCAFVFTLFAFLHLRRAPATIPRYFGLGSRAFLLLLCAIGFGTWFDIVLKPRDAGELPLAVWGLLVPAVPAVAISLPLGFVLGAAKREI